MITNIVVTTINISIIAPAAVAIAIPIDAVVAVAGAEVLELRRFSLLKTQPTSS